MAKTPGIKYPIELDDQATLVYQKFIQAVKAGEVDLSRVMDRTRDSTRKHGEEVNRLTQYIREERTEHRQQTFLFRQGMEVMQTGSIALAGFGMTMGRTSEGMRNLTNSLNQGFVAFQGMNNLVGLMGLGGPWGMAIAAVAGLGGAFLTMNAASAEASKALEKTRTEIFELQYQLGTVSDAQKLQELQRQRAQALKDLKELERVTSVLVGTASLEQGGPPEIIQKIVGSPEDIMAARKRLAELDLELKRFKESAVKPPPAPAGTGPQKGGKGIIPQMLGLDDARVMLQLTTEAAARLAIIMGKPIEGVPLAKVFEGMTNDMMALTRSEVAFLSVLDSGISAVMGRARADIRSLFGEVNTYLEEFMVAVLESIAGIAAQQLAAAATAGILSMFGFGFSTMFTALGGLFHQGGMVAHDGMRIGGPAQREMPILVRGGETVRTERQERDVQQKLNGGGGVTINVYGPVADELAFKRIIERGMRKAGLTADGYFRNDRATLALG